MDSFLEKMIEELGEETAKELYDLGVDNQFKLDFLKNAELEDDGDFIKMSYPNYNNQFFYKEYQMDKWEVAYKKYSMFRRLNYPDASIQNFFKKSSFDDTDELSSFLKWSKSKFDTEDLYKISSYGFGLAPNSHTDPSIYSLPGSSFRPQDPQIEKAKNIKEEKAKKENKTRKSIQRSLNSLMRTLQGSEEIDYETYERASELLYSLMAVFKKRYSPKIEKAAIERTSNAFKKIGLDFAGEELIKLSQEIPEQTEAPPEVSEAEQQQPQEVSDEVRPEQEGVSTESKEPVKDENRNEIPPDADPVDVRTIKTPGPSKDDYKSFNLDGVTIEVAAKKLDEVAATLADRRVIRMLAEFDIMLDALGIASMFPELAESQSKLIDSFSYALTRVSKMMGQISQAKTLIDAAKNVPGTEREIEPEAKSSQEAQETIEESPAQEGEL